MLGLSDSISISSERGPNSETRIRAVHSAQSDSCGAAETTILVYCNENEELGEILIQGTVCWLRGGGNGCLWFVVWRGTVSCGKIVRCGVVSCVRIVRCGVHELWIIAVALYVDML